MTAAGGVTVDDAPVLGGAAGACRSGGAILAATLELLAEHGMAGLTVDEVAARAKVGKATIYRHWRTRADLVMEALSTLPGPTPPAATGELRGDLCATLRALGEVLVDPARSRLLATLVDAAERDPELAELHVAHGAVRRAPVRALFDAAVARGELASDLDTSLAVDLVVGPLFYRRLLGHRPLTGDEIDEVVDAVLAGLGHVGTADERVSSRSGDVSIMPTWRN